MTLLLGAFIVTIWVWYVLDVMGWLPLVRVEIEGLAHVFDADREDGHGKSMPHDSFSVREVPFPMLQGHNRQVGEWERVEVQCTRGKNPYGIWVAGRIWLRFPLLSMAVFLGWITGLSSGIHSRWHEPPRYLKKEDKYYLISVGGDPFLAEVSLGRRPAVPRCRVKKWRLMVGKIKVYEKRITE